MKIHEELGARPPEFDDRPLGKFIESYAESIPENTALQYYERGISYRELNELSNQLANALAELNVGRDDVVGLHMPNIPQYIIAVIAISKLGATACGVSVLLAPREVAVQIEDAGISVLISLDTAIQPALGMLSELPKCLQAVIVTGADDLRSPADVALPDLSSPDLSSPDLSSPDLSSIDCRAYLTLTVDASREFRQIDLPADHVLLIQYTGGTTGKPKGAMLTLRGIMYNIPISNPYRPWEVGAETAISALPPFHIGGLVHTLRPLRYGARCVLIPNGRDMDHYCQQMLAFPPTRLAAVPTLYQMIADHPLQAKIDFSGMRNAQSGGAPVTGDDRKRIEEMLRGTVLSDAFGMTEAGPTATANPPERCKPESVGIPVPAVDMRIVDIETGTRELPYGEAGEIIISSPCLMKGYINQPQETANALRDWCGKTWMYTGDVGVMDDEGYIYLKDRAKDMIIVSGFKVFSVEVEDRLSALDFIARSALIGSPDTNRPGSEIVNLYVELTPDAKGLDPDKLKADITEFCRAEMAAYKVPRVIHIVDAIPLTPVGKIDKKALRS